MNENVFNSEIWGALTFFPTKEEGWNATCKHCLLARCERECSQAHCHASERADGKNGYFSIHEMPE